MPNASKFLLFAFCGLAGVLVLTALVGTVFVHSGAYKSRVASAASDVLGMSVTVEGPLRIGIVPGLHATLENVRIRNRGTEIAFFKKVRLAILSRSLFQRNLRYDSIALDGARITIERGLDGSYNFEKLPGAEESFNAIAVRDVTLTDLVVAYVDRQSGGGFVSGDCRGKLADLRHPGGGSFISRVSFTGQLTCGEVRSKDTIVSDVGFTVQATQGKFNFAPITMRLYGGEGSGSMRVDRSAEVAIVQLDFALSRFRVEELFKGRSSGRSVRGLMDFSTSLSMRGQTRLALRKSATGEMSLSGDNLSLAGSDIDRDLSKFKSSQNFSLFDLSAFLLAGPIGLAATKGYEISGLDRHSGESTRIRTALSKWQVEGGVAHARDVALATRQNRIALHGGLNFVDETYEDVTVAVIDSRGCVTVQQKIRGPFGEPLVEKSNVLASLAGSFAKLLNKARTLLGASDEKCQVFYNGIVRPPK